MTKTVYNVIDFSVSYIRDVYDHNGDVKASVKVKTIMAQKRFDVTYVSNNGESQVLFDKQSNGRGETYGILKFDGRILNIHSDENKYTVIKDSKQDKEIASWKQNGDYAYVEGKSELYDIKTLPERATHLTDKELKKEINQPIAGCKTLEELLVLNALHISLHAGKIEEMTRVLKAEQ